MFVFAVSIVAWCLGIAVIRHIVMPLIAHRVMGDGPAALLWYVNKVYVMAFHNLKAKGCAIIPNSVFPGQLIVVCKHQSPVDPLLVQSRCRFKIRWLMAEEYMAPSLAAVWKHAEVIPVSRDGTDSAGLRTALRHLKQDGVIGIFPEGGIHQPREAIHQFYQGAGALIAHTHAKVLLVTVDGTPRCDEMDQAIFEPSHATVRFLEILEFPTTATHEIITTTLRTRLSEATGWSLVD